MPGLHLPAYFFFLFLLSILLKGFVVIVAKIESHLCNLCRLGSYNIELTLHLTTLPLPLPSEPCLAPFLMQSTFRAVFLLGGDPSSLRTQPHSTED